MSRASNLAGFTTAVGPPTDLNVGVVTAISISAQTITSTDTYTFSNLDISESISVGSSTVGVTTINSSGINSPLGIGTFNEVRFRDGNTTNEIGIGASANDFIVSATSGGERLRVESGGNVGLGSTAPTVSVDISEKTDAVALPVGTTAQRPSTAYGGYIRWNSTSSALEVYNGTNWVEIISDYFPSGSTTLG